MSSTWKSLSNQRNAQKSTGPRTEAGKQRSRANALKHGLSGEGVVLATETLEAIATRLDEWQPGYEKFLSAPEKQWAFEQMVVNSVRIDECQRQEVAHREYDARRAELVWDLDKEVEVAVLGSKIAKQPAIVARQLRGSKYGCAWLMERWRILDRVLQSRTWNDEERELALDMAGLPRVGREELDDPEGLVSGEIALLEELIAGECDALDDNERILAMHGDPVQLSKKVNALRRYESACVKRFHAARRMLMKATVDAVEAIPVVVPEPVEEAPPSPYSPYASAEEERAAVHKAYREYSKAYNAASEEERKTLVPDIAPEVLENYASRTNAPVRLRDSVPACAAPPMNRKQRKAQARQQAQGQRRAR
jgi:hypothetical protein